MRDFNTIDELAEDDAEELTRRLESARRLWRRIKEYATIDDFLAATDIAMTDDRLAFFRGVKSAVASRFPTAEVTYYRDALSGIIAKVAIAGMDDSIRVTDNHFAAGYTLERHLEVIDEHWKIAMVKFPDIAHPELRRKTGGIDAHPLQ